MNMNMNIAPGQIYDLIVHKYECECEYEYCGRTDKHDLIVHKYEYEYEYCTRTDI